MLTISLLLALIPMMPPLLSFYLLLCFTSSICTVKRLHILYIYSAACFAPGCGPVLLDLQVSRPYHVRVLIPCYNESLEIVGKTAMAALDAMLPASCERTVYICDDGKDAAKRKW